MRVLFPVDGSRILNEAVDALASRTWPSGTVIKVVTVVPNSIADKVDHIKHDERLYQHELALQKVVSSLKEKLPECFFLSAAYDGHVVDEILAEAKAWPCDMIAMASHDRHGLERVLLGSVSHAVSMRSSCPVFIVKANPHKTKRVERIVVAIDHSKCSVEAMKWVASLPWMSGTEILMLSVVDTFQRYSNETSVLRAADILIEWQKKQSQLSKLLNGLADKLKVATGLQSVNVLIAGGDPRQAIIDQAENWGADLIVMGSHGRTGVSRVLMGSVAQAVLAHAPCSVEIVKTENSSSNGIGRGGKERQRSPLERGVSETHAFPTGLM